MFSVDIGVGDIVTPRPIVFQYYNYFANSTYEILAYSKETALAEKFQTIVSKGINNSRAKDLFDIYLLTKSGYDEQILNSAMVNTFVNRKTIYDKYTIKNILNDTLNFSRIKKIYENYSMKNKFVKDITFDDYAIAIYELYNKLIFNTKISPSKYAVELGIMIITNDIELNMLGDLLGKVDNYQNIIVYKEFVKQYLHLENSSRIICEECFCGRHKDESCMDFNKRICDQLIKVLNEYKTSKLLLIASYDVISAIICLINGYIYSDLLKISPKEGEIIQLM